MSHLLNGRVISDEIAIELTQKITEHGLKPKLVIVQIGNKEESNTYISHKIRFAERIGIIAELLQYPEDTSTEAVIEGIKKVNSDKYVHGIIVQLPIPENLSKNDILEAIDPKKDVDGLTSTSIKHMFDGEKGFLPGATKAILVLLEKERIDVKGKKVVIVGQSSLVGKPAALAMLGLDATVTVCNEHTNDLAQETTQANILITATGVPGLITAKHVSADQIVIDIGITVIPDPSIPTGKKVVGDVDFESVKDVVKAITPVPGGVGPITIACLMQNIVEAVN
ncbi:MAG TPA: bifunctional 5,10-methylenetetrahydrofolate dehydrogenase/5,10-methenyltetrahydrofolate cyclohydrolase [Candidatus Paceibacterota bacterium]|nr:bifunctional 5,10-methylenetetrahydrofolate dehydrogenase/5,10-methenyltetrahydrofolate cyclohydrolase [Candidatus Paceibacterota bacterium]